MFSNLSFIGKWKHWYRVCATARALDVFILFGMGCGWRTAESEDALWLESKP